MKVVILCGGLGTRLREETEYRPKPMVPIGGRPILWHIMKIYAQYGHKDFVLCLGYKGEMIKEYFRNYLWNTCDVTLNLGRESEVIYHSHHDEEDWTITLAETGQNSHTAHRIWQIQRYIPKGEPFMLTYGDGVGNIDIPALIQTHKKSGKLCTLTAVHPTGRFGAISLDDDGGISTFEEKPQMENNYVNGGYMVCEYGVFDYFTDDPAIMLEKGPIMNLLRAGQLNSSRHEGFWQPMDTFQEMQYLNQLWNENRAPWKMW
jgi:glucose-1-phosphate cytidylyltransferase